jgi:hypothetical protein
LPSDAAVACAQAVVKEETMLPVLFAAWLASPQAPPAPPRPCTSPVHRQFDFWLGTWDVVGANGRFAGVNRIELVDGGCALYESWSSGGGGYTGRSLNSVGGDGRWRQTWVDTGGLRLELVGGLVDGKMVLEGETPAATAGAPPVRNRITWSPEAEGRVRQHWETSADAGKTWTTAFDGTYHAVKAPVTDKTSFLRTIAGGWIGSGTVMRRESHVELSVAPVLAGKFVRLHWVNSGGKDGRDLFEGLAVYEERPDGTFAATWWDSQGSRHAVTAALEGQALTALWGERGRTVYRLLETGELEVVDSVKRPDGSWGEFGRNVLKRK